MRELNYTESHCKFKTKRLVIRNIIENNVGYKHKQKLAKEVLHIVTPKVTEFLPDSWQVIKNEAEGVNQEKLSQYGRELMV